MLDLNVSMTLRRGLLVLTATLLGVSLVGCDLLGSNDDAGTETTTGVYVANQGNFSDGNGSVTVYDPREQSAATAVSGLGSIVQGIAVRDTTLLVVANSAARVDVFSTDGPTQTGQITGVNNPRYAAFTGSDVAYVTDQSPFGSSVAPAVRVLDLDAAQVIASIPVSGTPEGITTTEERAYAALGAFGDTSLVAAIDRTRNTLIDEIDIGCFAREVVADGDGDVFALCSNAAEAVVLDGSSGTIQTRLSLPDTAETAFGVGHPAGYSAEARELHVATDTGVLRIDTESNEVGSLVDVGISTPPGAVGYSASRRQLYVARVPEGVAGFTTQGTVTLHNRNGERTGSFETGIAPTYIDFRRGIE